MTHEAIAILNHIAGEVPMRLKGAGATMVKTEVNGKAVLKLDKRIRLAGCKFENENGVSRQKTIKFLSPDQILTLVREPENPKDKNAIGVYYTGAKGSTRIGFIPAHLAAVIAADMDNGFNPTAVIVDMYEADKVYHPVIHLFEYLV